MANTPKGAGDAAGMKKLAQELKLEIDAGKAQKATRQSRHDRVFSQYMNEGPKPTKASFPGACDSNLNLMQFKIDALGSNVFGPMISQQPYCVADTHTADEANIVLEDVVQFFAEKDRLEEKLIAISSEVGLYNIGVIKSEFKKEGTDYDKTPSMEHTPIEIQDSVFYPAIYSDVTKCKLVGDRFWLRHSVIKRAQQKGTYLKTPIITSGGPGEARSEYLPNTSGNMASNNAGEQKNELVELYNLTFRRPNAEGDEVWWDATYAYNEQEILKIDTHKESRPGYHIFRYKPALGEMFPKGSVGNDLQGVQLDVNDLWRNLIDGIRFNIFGAVFMQSAGMPEQFKTYGPGSMVELPTVGDIVPYNPKADLNFIPGAIAQIYDLADQISRIRASSTGGEPEKGVSATAETIANAGQQSGLNNYLMVANAGLVSLYDYDQESLAINSKDWIEFYGDFLGIPDGAEQVMFTPAIWNAHTKSIGTTPGNQMQLAQMITEKSQLPGSSIDTYVLETRVLKMAERLGFTNARDLQLPQDVQAVILEASKRAGVDPQLVMDAIEAGEQTQGLIQEGENVKRKEESVETIRVGMGLPEEKPCPPSSDGAGKASPKPKPKASGKSSSK